MQITNVGKYIGFQLGPKAGAPQWVAPLEKFKQRVKDIRSSDLPLGLAASQYASRAVPVLGYVGQSVPPPAYYTCTELWAAHKISGIPLALDVAAIHGLDVLGSTKLVRASSYLRSCMLRAASKTLQGHSAMHTELVELAVHGSVLEQVVRGGALPQGWDSCAFATHLHRASCGSIGLDMHAGRFSMLCRRHRKPHAATQNQGLDMRIDSIRSCVDSVAGEILKGRKSQQAAFYSHLQSPTLPNWSATLARELESCACLANHCTTSYSRVDDSLLSNLSAPLKNWATCRFCCN